MFIAQAGDLTVEQVAGFIGSPLRALASSLAQMPRCRLSTSAAIAAEGDVELRGPKNGAITSPQPGSGDQQPPRRLPPST